MIIWCCDDSALFTKRDKNDKSFLIIYKYYVKYFATTGAKNLSMCRSFEKWKFTKCFFHFALCVLFLYIQDLCVREMLLERGERPSAFNGIESVALSKKKKKKQKNIN